MDVVLDYADGLFLNALYALPPFSTALAPHFAAPDSVPRQCFSLWLVVWLAGAAMYLAFATLSYVFLFDKSLERHPKFLKNQKWLEISLTMRTMPFTSLYTVPWFLGEIHGYSKLYSNVEEYGIPYMVLSFIGFLFFTDMCIYWIHRWEHHPLVYGWLHKPHHLWKISTPYASHAFHSLDGYFQSLPYHWFIYLFPFNKYLYLFSFIFVNFWSISIHDQLYVSEDSFVNGAAHHTLHHREFNYNYGQYFTLWDKIGGSYKRPEEFFEEKHTGHVIPAARERKPDDEPESDGEVRPVDSRPARKEKSEGANGVGATPARRRTKKAQ